MWNQILLLQMYSLVSEESHTNSFVDNTFWKHNVFWKHNLFSPRLGVSSVRSCITAYLPAFPERSKSKTGYSNRCCQKKNSFQSPIWPVGIRTEEKELSDFHGHLHRCWTAHISPVLHIVESLWKVCFNGTREQILCWAELAFCALN